MRLYEILNSDDYADIKAILNRDCAPYIEVLKQTRGHPLFRGSDSGRPPSGNLTKISPKLERKPKDTPIDIHNFMNSRFQAKFGYPFRNGIFASGEQRTAAHYGLVNILFPIGKLNYIWSSQVDDLVYVIDRIYTKDEFDDEDTINQNPQLAQEFENLIDTYKSVELDRCILSNHEVIFANDCYLVSLSDYEYIIKGLLT